MTGGGGGGGKGGMGGEMEIKYIYLSCRYTVTHSSGAV